MCKSKAPSGATNAVNSNAAIAQKSLALADSYDAAAKSRQASNDELFKNLIAKSSELTDQALQQSQDQWNSYKTNFLPLDAKLSSTALNFDTTERRNAAAADAQNNVQAQGDAASAGLDRTLASRGVDVTSGNALAAKGLASVATAAQKATAGNQARKDVEATGINLVNNAANYGRGVATGALQAGQTAQSGVGTTAGLSSTQNAMKAQDAAATASLLGSSVNANSSSGNLALGAAEAGSNARNGLMGGIGSIGQAAGSLWSAVRSSKKLKTKVADVGSNGGDAPGPATRGLSRLKVDAWKYKDGVPDQTTGRDSQQQTHVGPYAEDTQREFGDGVAPGGRMINMDQAMKVNQQAITELTRAVTTLAKRVHKLQAENVLEVA